MQRGEHVDLVDVAHKLWQPSKFHGALLMANALNICNGREVEETAVAAPAPAALSSLGM